MFRQYLAKLSARVQQFMVGRYGTDRLNMTILSVGLVACLISPFFKNVAVNLLLTCLWDLPVQMIRKPAAFWPAAMRKQLRKN